MKCRPTGVQIAVLKACASGATAEEMVGAVGTNNDRSIRQACHRLMADGRLFRSGSYKRYRYWSTIAQAAQHQVEWDSYMVEHRNMMRCKWNAAATESCRARREAEKLARPTKPPKPPKPKRVRKAAPKATETAVKLRPNKLPSKPVKRGPAYLSGPLVFTDQTRRVVCPNVPQSLRTNTYSVY